MGYSQTLQPKKKKAAQITKAKVSPIRISARQRQHTDEANATELLPLASDMLRRNGQPLDPDTRALMERRFGYDFSRVRIHTDAKAAAIARSLHADAFTRGQDIFFAADRYEPDTTQGQRLLAHELAHTLQQRQEDLVQPRAEKSHNLVIQPRDPLEHEAGSAARQIARGHMVPPQSISFACPQAQGLIARQVASPTAPTVSPSQVQTQSRQDQTSKLDPTTLIESLAERVLLSLKSDPDDLDGKVRRLISKLAPSTLDMVMARIQVRTTPEDWERLNRVLTTPIPEVGVTDASVEVITEAAPAGAEAQPTEVPTEEITPKPEEEVVEEAAKEVVPPIEAEAPPLVPETKEAGAAEVPSPGLIEGAEAPAGGAAEAEMVAPPSEAAAAGPLPTPTVEGGGEAEAVEVKEGSVAVEKAPALAAEAPAVEGAAVEGAEKPAEGAVAVPEVAAVEPTEITPVREEAAAAPAEAPEMAPAPEAAAEPGITAPGPETEPAAEAAPPTPEVEAPTEEAGAPEAEPTPEGAEAPETEPATEAAPPTPEVEAPAEEAEAPEALLTAEAVSPAPEAGPTVPTEMAAQEVPTGGVTTTAPEVAPGAAEGEELAAPSIETATGPEQEAAEQQAGISPVATLPEVTKTGEEGPSPGGGGSGSPIEEPAAPQVPDVSQSEPSQALAQVGNLPPAQLVGALGGVSAAASRSVSEQRAELAANPPQMELPASVAIEQGKPAEGEVTPAEEAGTKQRIEPAPEGQLPPNPQPVELPPEQPLPTENISGPRLGGNAPGESSPVDAQQLQSSLSDLPTTDPALNVTAGPAPQLTLEGNADPARAQEQRAQLEQGTSVTQAQGRAEAAQPMGEQSIYPDRPQETLSAEAAGATTGTGGATAAAATPAAASAPGASPSPQGVAGGGSGNETAASMIAQQVRGDEIRASVTQARADMEAKKKEQANKAGEARANAQRDVEKETQENASQQSKERTEAQTEVQKQRDQWTKAQTDLADDSRTKADQAQRDGEKEVTQARNEGEAAASKHIQQGNADIEKARNQGEHEAKVVRQEAANKSKGVLDWLVDKAKAFFNDVKASISAAFERARKVVRAAIQKAQQLAGEVIDKGRQAIVGIIQKTGGTLISISDRLLSGFPGLCNRFRQAIQKRVDGAVARVNSFADKLKEGVQRVLNLLGSVLEAALGVLEKGLLMAVDGVSNMVQGAIKYANSIIQGFGVFVALIKDIAANPMQWLRNLGAAVVDGIRTHLWKAFKQAIKEWFNQKVEEVLGLGLTIWNILRSGGISLAQIGSMAWEAIKQAIPMVLIQVLIEKLVEKLLSILLPAAGIAGAIMDMIKVVQAAWGAIQRIIAAIQAFVDFLKAVKGGNAGPKFATMLVAAAIAVIDFVANWLLQRLRKPAGAVAGSLRALAQKIGKGLKKALQAVKKVVGKVVGGVKKGVQAVVRGVKAVARGIGRVVKIVGKGMKKLGKFGKKMGQGLQWIGKKFKGWTKTLKEKWNKFKEDWKKQAFPRARKWLQRALSRSIRKSIFRGLVRSLKLIFRFKKVAVHESETQFEIRAGFSPDEELIKGVHEKDIGGSPTKFVWRPEVIYDKVIASGGMQGLVDYGYDPDYAIDWKTLKEEKKSHYEGHHSWPWNALDAPENQPLVAIRAAIHRWMLHIELIKWMKDTLNLSPLTREEIRSRIAEGDLTYDDIRRELYSFYNRHFRDVPRRAWALGIDYSYKDNMSFGAKKGAKKRKR